MPLKKDSKSAGNTGDDGMDGGDQKVILSPRETEILKLVANGLTADEIASQLFVSLDTVETHKRNVLKKLDARNTAEAVAKAIRGKLI